MYFIESRYCVKRAFNLSIFRIEIDKGCSILSKIEAEIAKARSTTSIFMPIFVSIFLHEIDKASSSLHEIAIEIAKLINIKLSDDTKINHVAHPLPPKLDIDHTPTMHTTTS
jgi:hypothetical protein